MRMRAAAYRSIMTLALLRHHLFSPAVITVHDDKLSGLVSLSGLVAVCGRRCHSRERGNLDVRHSLRRGVRLPVLVRWRALRRVR